MPRRRRRRAKAVAVEPEDERGFVMRMLLHSPKDLIAGLLAAAAVSAIIANALFLQAGRHPSPMFGTVVAIPATAPSLPRPRPVAAAARVSEPLAPPQPRRGGVFIGSPRLPLQRKSHAKGDLVMANGPIFDVASRLHDLEPFHIANGF